MRKSKFRKVKCLGTDVGVRNPIKSAVHVPVAVTLLLRLCKVFVLICSLFCSDCVISRGKLTEKLICKTNMQVVNLIEGEVIKGGPSHITPHL